MSSSRRVCQPRAFPITASVTFEDQLAADLRSVISS